MRPAGAGGFLAAAAMDRLARFLERHTNHRPSGTAWEALGDLLSTLEAMAEGKAAPRFYLSSLDPGMGKTAAVVAFVDTLLSYPDYEHVGVLICLSRLEEIRGLAQRMGIPRDWLAVVTSDAEVNALGSAEPNSARVLFTTHAMLEKRTDGRTFAGAREFHYQGAPRRVRIWDESVLPGQALTVARDDIAFLFRPLRAAHPALTDTLETIFGELGALEDGARYTLPDFPAQHGVTLNDALALLSGAAEDQRAALTALWFLSGKVATVRKDGALGQTALDYRDTLPADLAPMVILDASGRVRQTYRNWEESRGNLCRLKAAPKRYDNLTVHVWNTGGGKGSFDRKADELASGIAATINASDEEWLVVCHKARGKVDTENQVRSLLLGNPARVSFVTWGQHDATNRFSHVPNVILAGTLFYRASFYEALGRASAGITSADGAYSREDTMRVLEGENRHLVLQALCRGSVRSSDGDVCRPCNAYIIAATRSGIPAALPEIFPGCTVVPWRPIKRSLRGHIADAVEYIERWLAECPTESVLPFKQVARAVGLLDNSNFRRAIRQHPQFREAIAELGLVEWGPRKNLTGFLRTAPADLFADA